MVDATNPGSASGTMPPSRPVVFPPTPQETCHRMWTPANRSLGEELLAISEATGRETMALLTFDYQSLEIQALRIPGLGGAYRFDYEGSLLNGPGIVGTMHPHRYYRLPQPQTFDARDIAFADSAAVVNGSPWLSGLVTKDSLLSYETLGPDDGTTTACAK